MHSEQVLIKPMNRLQESLLLGKFLDLDACVASNRESMRHTREQINLVWLLGLNKNGLGFMTLLGWENRICFGGRDGERSLDSGKLFLIDEAKAQFSFSSTFWGNWQTYEGCAT